MAAREEGYEPPPQVLVTIHGRVFAGTLRRRGQRPECDEWRWCVELQVDDRRVMIWVPADQVELVGRGESEGA